MRKKNRKFGGFMTRKTTRRRNLLVNPLADLQRRAAALPRREATETGAPLSQEPPAAIEDDQADLVTKDLP
jgi:hypothetical protein